MKRFIYSMMMMLATFSMVAQTSTELQVLSDFQGTVNVAVANPTGNAGEYQVQGFFTNTTGRYSSDDIQIGHVLYGMAGSSCVKFEVTAITSKSGGILNATVKDLAGVTTNYPTGINAIMNETANFEFPLYNDGISGDLMGCIRTHFTKLVDKAEFSTDDQTLGLTNNSLSIEDGNAVDLSMYLDDTDTDEQTLGLNANQLSIVRGNSVDLSGYLDNTDAQEISKTGNTLSITGGTGTVDLSAYLDDTDAQTIGLSGNTLSIVRGNSVDLSGYLDNTDNQEISKTGDIISITGGSQTIDLSAYLDDTNTDEQTIGLSGNTLSIVRGNSVDLSGYLDNTDAQTISKTGNTLSITGSAGTVDLSEYLDDTDTDEQTLGLSGNTLSIVRGNSVDLSGYLDNTDAQDMSLTGNTLSLTGDATAVDLSGYLDNTDNQGLTISGNTLGISGSASTIDLSAYLDDTDTDMQTLGLAGNTLSIVRGNSVDLSGYLDNTDSQDMSLSGNTLSLSGDATTVDLSQFLDDTDAQTLGLSANTLSIVRGNSVDLSGYLDNTDNQEISKTGNTLSITGGTGTVDLSAYLDDTDTDEQTISLSGNTLAIVRGNSVDLSGYLDNTDNQDLSLAGNTLSLTGDAQPVDLSGYLDNTDEQAISKTGDILSITGNGSTVDLSGYTDVYTGGTTSTADVSVTANEITAVAKISAEANNQLEAKADGLYAKKFAMYTYTVGVATITSTSPNCTFTNSGGTGTVVVPEGEEVFQVTVHGDDSMLDGSNNYYLVLDKTNAGHSTADTDYVMPNVQVTNTASKAFGGPSASLPFIYDEGASPQRQVVGIANGDVTVRIINANSYADWDLKVSL